MITIGLFGSADDQEVEALARRLRNRGARPWVVDLGALAGRLRVAMDAEGIRIDGRPLGEMAAAYLRQLPTCLPPHARYDQPEEISDPRTWQALYPKTVEALAKERATHALRTAVVYWLSRRIPVINPPQVQNLHRLKTWLLTSLRRKGRPVPEFAVGTSADALRSFIERAANGPGTVEKPLAGLYKTHLLTSARRADYPWGSRPAFYQRYVPGDTIRCYVLAGRLLSAARIVHGGTVDSSMSQTGIEVVELPDEARKAAQDTAKAFDLAFCGLDLQRERGTGRYFVIDCNLSPMFVNSASSANAMLPVCWPIICSVAPGIPRPTSALGRWK